MSLLDRINLREYSIQITTIHSERIIRDPTTKQGNSEIIPVKEDIGNLEICPKHKNNTGNVVFPGCGFHDSIDYRYCFFFC